MTNGGVPGNPLVIRVGGVESSAEAILTNSTATNYRSGSAVVVVSEQDKGKWHDVKDRPIAQFKKAQTLNHFDLTVTDPTTGLPASYSAVGPTGATHILILKFAILHSPKDIHGPTHSYGTALGHAYYD
jgi:hypothetical protein